MEKCPERAEKRKYVWRVVIKLRRCTIREKRRGFILLLNLILLLKGRNSNILGSHCFKPLPMTVYFPSVQWSITNSYVQFLYVQCLLLLLPNMFEFRPLSNKIKFSNKMSPLLFSRILYCLRFITTLQTYAFFCPYWAFFHKLRMYTLEIQSAWALPRDAPLQRKCRSILLKIPSKIEIPRNWLNRSLWNFSTIWLWLWPIFCWIFVQID